MANSTKKLLTVLCVANEALRLTLQNLKHNYFVSQWMMSISSHILEELELFFKTYLGASSPATYTSANAKCRMRNIICNNPINTAYNLIESNNIVTIIYTHKKQQHYNKCYKKYSLNVYFN